MNRGVTRRLPHVFMATEHNREQSAVLLGDLYSVCIKLVQSEIQRSRERERESRDSSRFIFLGFNRSSVTKPQLSKETVKTYFLCYSNIYSVTINCIYDL
jgi:hypothetical protein